MRRGGRGEGERRKREGGRGGKEGGGEGERRKRKEGRRGGRGREERKEGQLLMADEAMHLSCFSRYTSTPPPLNMTMSIC